MERAEHNSDKNRKMYPREEMGRNQGALRYKEMRPEKSRGQKTKNLWGLNSNLARKVNGSCSRNLTRKMAVQLASRRP